MLAELTRKLMLCWLTNGQLTALFPDVLLGSGCPSHGAAPSGWKQLIGKSFWSAWQQQTLLIGCLKTLFDVPSREPTDVSSAAVGSVPNEMRQRRTVFQSVGSSEKGLHRREKEKDSAPPAPPLSSFSPAPPPSGQIRIP